MKLPISARLLACCDYIAPGDRVADIGCDHGYLGIYLLLNGISPHTIEADIRPGPLSAAVKNGEKYGVEDNMTFCPMEPRISPEISTLWSAPAWGRT